MAAQRIRIFFDATVCQGQGLSGVTANERDRRTAIPRPRQQQTLLRSSEAKSPTSTPAWANDGLGAGSTRRSRSRASPSSPYAETSQQNGVVRRRCLEDTLQNRFRWSRARDFESRFCSISLRRSSESHSSSEQRQVAARSTASGLEQI